MGQNQGMNSPGLRERKKLKTRWAIQEHAMRLFAEQGFEATTVDQIAAAAEISPSTFFRYFKTKDDLVIQDQYDDLILAGISAAPAELTPVGVLRHATKQAFELMRPEDEQQLRERSQLVISVPSLRARSFDNLLATMTMVRDAMAERLGRSADDMAMRAFAGALVGSILGVLEVWIEEPSGRRLADLVDEVLGQFEDGFPL